MTLFDSPFTITLDGKPLDIIGTDTGSYVADDGRTWPFPSGVTEPATDAAGVQAHIEATLAVQASDELATYKAVARANAQARRAALLAAGFTYSGKLIQTRNDTDIANINSAALRAVNDAAFATGWITADNSVLPLDAAGVIAMQAAMVEAGNAIYAAYLAVTAQIDAAADVAAVLALAPTIAAFAP